MTDSEVAVLATLKQLVTLKLAKGKVSQELRDRGLRELLSAIPPETRPVYALGANMAGSLVGLFGEALEVEPTELWAKILVTGEQLGLEGTG